MDKGIGFNRTITLKWLNAAANLRSYTDNLQSIRQGLEDVLLQDMHGVDARRKTIDVLVNIWLKSEVVSPYLHKKALELLPEVSEPQRVWLHYGLTLVYYPFFRQCTALIGQVSRVQDSITRQLVKNRLAGDLGHFGSLNRSAERVMASLLDWGILSDLGNNEYKPEVSKLEININEVEEWVLSCALFSHPAEELPFSDLLNLPELFPFLFSITLDDFRNRKQFSIQRQGGWEMVRLRKQ
jgi:hypothetical protein